MNDRARVALPVAVTLSVQTLVALAVYSTPVMAPIAAPALGVAPSAIGYFIALVYLGSMLGSVGAGGWMQRHGPIRVSQAGLALCLAGLALGAAAMLPLAVLGAVLIGLGYGPTTPASSQILARAAPRGMFALVFSIKQTGVPAGGALAGAIVPTLVLAFGWERAALGIGAACLLLAAAIEPARARYDRELDPAAPLGLASALAPVGMVLRARGLRELALAGFVYGGAQITLVAYLVTFLTQAFGLSLVFAGAVMAASQVASVAGRVFWGVLADRWIARRTMLGLLGLGMGASAIATLAAGPEWPDAATFAFAAVFGATAVGWNGVFLAEVARLAPERKIGEATGGCLFFTFLGVVLAPMLFNGLLAVFGGYAAAYAALGIPALAMGARLLAAKGAAR